MASSIYENYLLCSTRRLSLDNAGLNTGVPILAHLLLGIYAWRARTRAYTVTDGHTAMYIQRAYRVERNRETLYRGESKSIGNASLDFRFRGATTGKQVWSIGGKGVNCRRQFVWLLNTRESTGE